MFYWWMYTAEWEELCEHVPSLQECFINTYHSEGGPLLDKATYHKMYILTALEHNTSLIATVPLIYKMCKQKEFATIKSRKDPRLFDTIDGKSTCRVYLHTWTNVCRMLLEWGAADVLTAWVEEFSKAPFQFSRQRHWSNLS